MNATKRLATTLSTLFGALLLTGTSSAQADNCGAATPISGFGIYSYSTNGSTTDGPSNCGAMANDVWFSWTSPDEGIAVFSTCGPADFDTVVSVYEGSCGQLILQGCNDNAPGCGLTSQLELPVTIGQTFLVQLGGNQGETGFARLTVSYIPPSDCANPAVGPDVIVGDLMDIGSYTGVGGVGAYAIGTNSCNVGTAVLSWVANNNEHPVIGQNIYRHEGNTFEQLGMSWLKHGFGALSGNLCCTCTPPGAGSGLGIGCSDPYTAGLNGNQFGLGPRYQVNAFTGDFSYPYDPGVVADSTSKRIQVNNADLDPSTHSTATIIGEGQYVTADDAAAGNQFNNVSWRELTVGTFTDGRWTLDMAGETNRREAAILAWPTLDPNAVVESVLVPNEGLFMVGNTATDNGDGTWHYDYAVYNQNSHASCGSFSIPVPSFVNVTNMDFRDVDYHSGEPFSGTDWTGVRGTSDVSWATETFAANSNANAIRWGTLYNFRFDADVPPSAIIATLGLFRPNTPNSVAVQVRGPDCAGVVATESSRAGSPANPVALLPGVTSRPITGQTWDPVVSHASFYPTAMLDFLAVNSGNATPINAPLAIGTLLCNVPDASSIYVVAPGAGFSIGIPDDCSIVGINVCTQGGALGGTQGLQLTNALDLVIGNM